MLGKYINGGSPQNGEVWRLTGSGVHDTSLLAHCWRFLLLYALVSGYLLRLRIAMDVVYGKGNDVEFSIHCERNRPTLPLRWKFSRCKKNYLKVGETWHLRLKKKEKETLPRLSKRHLKVAYLRRIGQWFVENKEAILILHYVPLCYNQKHALNIKFIVSKNWEKGFVSRENLIINSYRVYID